ncbi:MAG: hypothetical protein ABW252_01410 [Polyangiales bacterium]
MSTGCAEELRCYEGAVEVNGVCECQDGTAFVRASNRCEPLSDEGGRAASDGGAVSRDAAVVDAATRLDAATPPREPEPVAPPKGGACSDDWLLCGDVCVDSRASESHCGGCGQRCGVGAVCEAGTCREVGCSDGTREAFVEIARFADVAGCAATWPKRSMRAAREIGSCGNGLGGCRAPVDACAPGWHVCGAVDGPADVTARIAQADCVAQPGRFAIALGDHSCTDCGERASGAACCGAGCLLQGGDCLWPDATAWFGALGESRNLCREIENPLVRADVGVMCCRDR